jgi:hypothetical protein
MSVQQSFGRRGLTPFDAGPPGQSTDWADQLMQTFLRSTEIGPPAGLAHRIRDRVAEEPRSTAPRRFVGALRARSLPGIWRGFVQSVSAAFDPGTRSMVLRVQALIVVLVVIGATSFGGAAALAAAVRVVKEVRGPVVTEPRRSTDGTGSSHSDIPPAANGPQVKISRASTTTASTRSRGRPAGRVEATEDGLSGLQPPAETIVGSSDNAPRGQASEQARSAPSGRSQSHAGPPSTSGGAAQGNVKNDQTPSAPNGNAYGQDGLRGNSGKAPQDKAKAEKPPSAPTGDGSGRASPRGHSGKAPQDKAKADKARSAEIGNAYGQAGTPGNSGNGQGQDRAQGSSGAAGNGQGQGDTGANGNAGNGQGDPGANGQGPQGARARGRRRHRRHQRAHLR